MGAVADHAVFDVRDGVEVLKSAEVRSDEG